MKKDHRSDDERRRDLASPDPAESARTAAESPKSESRQDVTASRGARGVPDRSSPGNPDAAGPAPDGLENDSWNPSIQAAGSLDEAAEAARQAAHAAGREANPLFTGSPGEEGPAPNIPSTLNMNRRASAARTGRAEMEERRRLHTEASPEVSGGDVDADWVSGEFVGDETPAGDSPTPGMSDVESNGRAMGVDYQDSEELKGAEKIEERDRHRWELDPASSEDYQERNREDGKT